MAEPDFVKGASGGAVYDTSPSGLGITPSYLGGAVATANSATYSTYTPTWSTTGTAPAIGNATVVAKYANVGKMVHCFGSITFGSSSTFGTGTFTFLLPVAASASVQAAPLGNADMFDSSGNVIMLGYVICALSGLGFSVNYGATYGGTLATATVSSPWTWATGDIFQWNFMYEAA